MVLLQFTARPRPPALSLLLLVLMSGAVVSQQWCCKSHDSVCAVKGSTAMLSCYKSYTTCPYRFQTCGFWSNLFLDPWDSFRIQYVTSDFCSITLSDATQLDQIIYTIMTHQQTVHVSLSVTELEVEIIPGSVVEGYDVTLKCKTSCSLTGSLTFIWYKQEYFHFPIISYPNPLHLTLIKFHSNRSPADTPDVQYPPKSVSVSISPSGEIVEGSSVTLTCSSDANPPVHTYTWYKGSWFLRTGKTYTISAISSADSGDHTCQAENKHGHQSSIAVFLNVQYPPKNVSVSISSSGEIVEGSSVTLTCRSHANPPVKTHTWYKHRSYIGTGKTYTMCTVSPADSGDYTCKAENKHGHQSSTAVSLNVLYPPKRVSVSISPSGEIVEGRTVTLTCSSDANPPAETHVWYLGESDKGTEITYTITNISRVEGGEYKCKSSNQYGEKYSDKVTINVLYPPKNVSVSISPSGEIVEDSPVTLTCSSDANPPVQNYTWYKVNESSPVGSGQSFSFTLSSNSSGWFYCVAQNKYGAQRAAAVPLTLNESASWSVSMILGITLGVCGVGAFIVGLFCMRSKREKSNVVNHEYENDSFRVEPTSLSYITLDPATRSSNDAYSTLATINHH